MLAQGVFGSAEELVSLLGPSRYISPRHLERLRETCLQAGLDAERCLRETDASPLMEGLYIKIEEDGRVKERLKYVRASFAQAVDSSGSHWLDRPIVPNGLDRPLDSPLGVLLRPLGDTPQEPRWHGEGDVLTHTRLVLEALAEADARGRLAADRAEVLERLELGFLPAEELGILERPYAFASPRAELAYFEGRLAYPAQELYDDSWGEVLLLCGLPGTGKDTWLRANAPGLAVVSPDEVRAEYGLPPTGPQEEVMRLAAERAKALLRQRIPFAWNATSVSQSLRARQLELFSRYGARVRIVYLETGWETGLARNAARALGGCARGLAVYLSRNTACAPSAGAGFQRRPGVGGWRNSPFCFV